MIVEPGLSDEQRALIAEKRAALEGRGAKKNSDVAESSASVGGATDAPMFPPSATLCHKCNTKALVLMDGCQTCLNCGYSKCG
jgi:hypothetical protein